MQLSTLQFFVRLLLLGANLAGMLYLSASITGSISDEKPEPAGIFVVSFSVFTVSFLVLAYLNVFHLMGYGVLTAGYWLVALWLRPDSAETVPALQTNAFNLKELFSSRFYYIGWLLTFPLLKACRSIVSPPLAWDSLTYHLTRAAIWIQRAGFEYDPGLLGYANSASYNAPDAWKRYKYFLPTGDGFSAWFMLPLGNDLLIPAAWFLVWLLFMHAIYCLTREYGGSRQTSVLTAFCAGLIPAIFNHAFTAYIDNLVGTLFIYAIYFLAKFEQQSQTKFASLSLLATAVACTVKKTAWPGFPFIFISTIYIFKADENVSASLKPIGKFTVLLFFFLLSWPLYLWHQTGSPFFPTGFPSLGFDIYPYKSFTLASLNINLSRGEILYRLSWGGQTNSFMHNNFGAFTPLLFVLSLPEVVRRVRDRQIRVTTLCICSITIVVMIAFFYKFGGWGDNHARYIIGPFCAFLAIFGSKSKAHVKWLLGLALLGQTIYFYPPGIGHIEYMNILLLTLKSLPFWAVGGFLLFYALQNNRPLTKTFTCLAMATIILPTTIFSRHIRDKNRGKIYSCAAAGECFSNHLLTNQATLGLILARHVDTSRELNIAVTAGWGGKGHNWFVYPFFGSGFQNNLHYIPTSADGTALDHNDKTAPRSKARWLDRLKANNIDYILLLGPPPLELKWINESPSLFKLKESGPMGQNYLFRHLKSTD
jgi:hypothetical protein